MTDDDKMTMEEPSTVEIQSDTAITSPSAKAFFAALDLKKEEEEEEEDGSEKKKQGRQSEKISKRILTLGWRNRHSQEEHYPVSLQQPSTQHFSVRQVQRGELEGKYGTGATVWPASMVLIKYLERHAEAFVQGKRVVDLGAGTGVTSIAAAYFGAKRVVCTDGEPNVVRLARDNIENVSSTSSSTSTHDLSVPLDKTTTTTTTRTATTTNVESFSIHGVTVDVQQYWWGDGVLCGGNDFDLVIVSDCVLPKLYPISPLVDALDDLLGNDDAVAVVSYEHRYFSPYDPRDKFRELAQAKSLVVEQVPMEEQDEIYSVDDIEMWLVRRRR